MTEYARGGGDVSLLATSEQFFYALTPLTSLHHRLDALLLMVQFDQKMDDIKNRLQTVERAASELRSCKRLQEVLTSVLAFMNHMNGITEKGTV
jgi:hypothetical protein